MRAKQDIAKVEPSLPDSSIAAEKLDQPQPVNRLDHAEAAEIAEFAELATQAIEEVVESLYESTDLDIDKLIDEARLSTASPLFEDLIGEPIDDELMPRPKRL